MQNCNLNHREENGVTDVTPQTFTSGYLRERILIKMIAPFYMCKWLKIHKYGFDFKKTYNLPTTSKRKEVKTKDLEGQGVECMGRVAVGEQVEGIHLPSPTSPGNISAFKHRSRKHTFMLGTCLIRNSFLIQCAVFLS